MIYRINITHDEERDRWIAKGEEIGIVLESGSLDALFERVSIATRNVVNSPFTLVFEMYKYSRDVL